MAFRASNAIPAEKYFRAKQVAVQIKGLAESRSASFGSGAGSDEILALADNLNAMKTSLQNLASAPGMAAYAREQEDDPTYDVVAEYNALIAAADAVINEIVTTLPADGNGWLLIYSINPDASLQPRNFTTGQLNPLRSLLNALAATIS